MPSEEILERFIRCVESNDHVAAVETFYTPDSTMQENQNAPRVGRDAHAANERKVTGRTTKMFSKCVRPVFVDGDRVVIRWNFEFDWSDGTFTRMDEIAYQRWDGELIAEEIFFYDPAQRLPKPR
jgi:hypothetical protein